MYIKEFTLKQHTPVIHFQANDTGATLRASEVKPKLDKFMVDKLGAENIRSEHKEWIRRDENNTIALDYALSFVVKGSNICRNEKLPMFFGNMGSDNIKNPTLHNTIIGKIKCKHKKDEKADKKELLDYLLDFLPEFFFLHNFGTRQSKGYGSFTVEKIENKRVKFEYSSKYSFFLNADNWQKAMAQLDFFYKSLRSGINIGKAQSFDVEPDAQITIDAIELEQMDTYFYMKPVIFLYAKQKYEAQWDKKSIKQTFFNKKYTYYYNRKKDGFIQTLGLKEQINSFEDAPDILTFNSSIPYFDFRDLFGLSTSESWRSYGATITKSIKDIDRYKSPITFKVLEQKKGYNIYVILEPIDSQYLKSDIIVKSKIGRNENTKELPLKMPIDFNLNTFFDFISTEFSLDDSIKEHYKNYEDPYLGNLYEILNNIYEQLRN